MYNVDTMSCTKEEIEKKRLAALQKRQSKKLPETGTATQPHYSLSSHHTDSQIGPLKSNSSNSPKSFHPYASSYNQKEKKTIPVDKVISGTVYLISKDRFEVKPSEFCAPLIGIFKEIASKKFDAHSKLWNFSIDDYEVLMSKVAPLAPHVVLGPIPPYVLKILRENLIDPDNVDLTPVESTLHHKLLPFQEEGVRFAIARGGRCMIADDMGLGKTFQALAVASYYRSDWPLLIVTTSSMREVWQSKIHELLPSVPLMNIVTLTNGRDAQLVADKQTEVVIVSFKILSMHTELLKNKNFGFVIVDESHNLKSHKAQCTISLRGAARRCRRAVLLSGTPALSRPAELYSQLAIIQPALLPSYTDYGKRYCNGKQTAFGWDMSGQSHLSELQIILQRRFLIRRTKEQVLTLEEKTREKVLLEESMLQVSGEQLSSVADEYRRGASADKHAALVTYFSETARIKIPAVCKYMKQLVKEEKDKFIVFAHHRCMIEAICNVLDEEAVSYICIVGATPANTRAELVDKFQHGSCGAAVLSVTACGAGLTLTAAALVLFAELHWNPGILTQAESRAHRLGRVGAVRARYLVAERTADTHIWPLLQDKLNVLNDVGLSRDSFQDTTSRHQESKNHITQYLTPSKNKNDFIPGTNIRIDSQNNNEKCPQTNGHINNINNNSASSNNNENGIYCDIDKLDDIESEFLEKSFLDNDEDDELLANLDL